MKKLCAVVILIIASFNCGGGSSSDDAADYILQPGSLSTSTLNESYNITFNGAQVKNPGFAIVYRGVINGTSYIGISVDDDGDLKDNIFNLKLYFQGSSLPTTPITLTAGTTPGFAISIVEGSPYSALSTGDKITLDFSSVVDNIVTIKSLGTTDPTIKVDGVDLTINEIKAYYYNASQ